jgi:hypothetical protein
MGRKGRGYGMFDWDICNLRMLPHPSKSDNPDWISFHLKNILLTDSLRWSYLKLMGEHNETHDTPRLTSTVALGPIAEWCWGPNRIPKPFGPREWRYAGQSTKCFPAGGNGDLTWWRLEIFHPAKGLPLEEPEENKLLQAFTSFPTHGTLAMPSWYPG